MPGPRSRTVTLAQEVREKLEMVCRAAKSAQREVVRARIVLLACQGASNASIARLLAVTDDTVRKWRRRFVQQGLAGLIDRERSGRPCRFDAITRSELISLACRPVPAELCRNQWTHDELRSALLDAGLIDAISVPSVARLLAEVDLRPQRFKMWIHSPDPLFRPKVTNICALYTAPARPDEVVVCVDEKTGMQALRRRFPGRAPSPLEIGRWQFEYKRCGTRCLTAAFDVHTGDVFGRVTRRRTKQDLLAFLEALARRYPWQTVHVVWDNLNTHSGPHIEDFNRRHGGRFRFHYTPVHASWCNQIELWFSVLARRVLRRGSFADADDLEVRVVRFIELWNTLERHPFRWTFKGYPLQTGTRRGQTRSFRRDPSAAAAAAPS
jgi:transposase